VDLDPKKASFENVPGCTFYKLRDERYMLFFTKAIFQVNMNREKPLTFVHPDGRRFRTRLDFESDMGSTPYVTRLFFPKDRFLNSYFFHDDLWENGGLYVAQPGEETFEFVEMSRIEGNRLLRLMTMVEGAGKVRASSIMAAVDVAAAWQAVFRDQEERMKQ